MSDEPIRMREKCYPPVWLILNSIKRGIYEQGAGDGNVRYFSQFKNSYGKVWVELGFFKPLVFFNVVFVFDFVRSLSLSPSLLLSLSLSIYRRIPIITAPVIFGFSSPKGPLLSGGRYFRVAVTFGWLENVCNSAVVLHKEDT